MVKRINDLEVTYPLGQVSKQEYDEQVEALRTKLLTVQYELRDAGFPFILVISGEDDLAGRVVNRLHEWMDSRLIRTAAFLPPSDEESERPFFWRFWRALPARGRTGIYVQGWTTQSAVRRITGSMSDKKLKRRIEHIRAFERMLVDEGGVVLKIFIRPSEAMSEERLLENEQHVNVWTAGGYARKIAKDYKANKALVAEIADATSTEAAPWYVLPGEYPRSLELAIGDLIYDTLSQRLQEERPALAVASGPAEIPDALGGVDLGLTITDEDYKKRLRKWQERFAELTRQAYEQRRSTVIALEGWDAAGKGGVIRRLTAAMDAALYRVIPISAPTEHELAYPYLWRFWSQMPRPGRVVVFDRTWYGRVLVERVEGFASEPDWRRAFAEINDFERQLVDHGTILAKFWLHLDQSEQLDRFNAREKVPYKRYKITAEDYRNRQKWPEYEQAVNEMVQMTSGKKTPWHLVPANNKKAARIEVLKCVCKTMAKALKS